MALFPALGVAKRGAVRGVLERTRTACCWTLSPPAERGNLAPGCGSHPGVIC